jgi:hypothetical protein
VISSNSLLLRPRSLTFPVSRTCIVWDLNRLMYVRSIVLGGTVRVVAISSVNGRIFTASDREQDCCLRLWTINGRLLGEAMCAKDR